MSTAPSRIAAHPLDPDALARCLRRASSLAALAPLLRRLGLPATSSPIPRSARLRAGLGRDCADGVYRLAGEPHAFLAEPGDAGEAELAGMLYRLVDEPFLLICASAGYRTLSFGCRAPDGEFRHVRVDRLRPGATDLDILRDLASGGERGIALVIRWARVLDRRSIGARFFRDIRAQRDALARAWTGIPKRLAAERDQLALLLLCRLLFLGFLQERGHLLDDRDFLASCLRRWRERPAGPLHDALLRPLFFGVFNTRPEARAAAARELGPLPYLNGGLFEPHALERRHAQLSLPDDVLLRVFSDLLGRYRFTTRDGAEAAGTRESGIDPEVLGRVFEELMGESRRGDTGSFYTPPAVVDRLVSRALVHLLASRAELPEPATERLVLQGEVIGDAARAAGALPVLRALRVLDPACGSGAFLLGALSRITRARAALEPGAHRATIRREVVAHSLHGVDVLDDAALLCALRLWLALAPGEGESVAPLPNLDRRVRQGDALVDPLDLLSPGAAAGPQRSALLAGAVRRAVRALEPLGRAYLGAEPAQRPVLLAQLRDGELALARQWVDTLAATLEHALREQRAGAAYRDLWGLPAASSDAAARERVRLEKRLAEAQRLRAELADSRALPFFSFLVHFAAERSGFDLVLANPPWVRSHRWPAALAALRERFRVCRDAGWPRARTLMPAGGGGGQVDMALLFLERGIGLLADGGVIGMLLPAKLLRSLYAGGARALLLADTAVLEIEDHGLDQHAVFDADAFTVGLIARRAAPPADHGQVRVTIRNRGREPLAFELPQRDLPLVRGDLRSPWLLAPPRTAAALRAMQAAGVAIGETPALRLRRGVITGANDVLVVADAEHRLGGLSRVRAQGWFRARRAGSADAGAFAAWVETDALRPLLRGCDVKAWRWQTTQHVLWAPANERAGAPAPIRLERYLARHRDALARRTGGGAAAASGRLLRLSADSLGHKVVWQDIAADLNAVAVPDRVRGPAGTAVPVIPLNTVYFIGVAGEAEAHVLAALLNSLPLRTFARAIAERAKDARFRFFAWTVGMLPLPRAWRRGPLADALQRIAADAHRDGGIAPVAQAELDRRVAQAYGLDAGDLAALQEFDEWLRR